MFQVPTSIHISILRGLEAVQACAKKTIFRSLKNCFSAKPQFSSSYWVNNVPGPHVYPHIDFAWIGSSPSMCGKNNFSELEKLFFRKASVFFKLLGKQCSRSPRPSTSILRGLEAVQACAKKTIFRSLKNCFSAKPKFSSSYWGIQCFRSPRLSTYRFCVDWKQSKHVRKKQFFGA